MHCILCAPVWQCAHRWCEFLCLKNIMSTVYYFPHLHKLSLLLEAMKNCAIQYYVKKKNSFNVAGLKSIRNDKKNSIQKIPCLQK